VRCAVGKWWWLAVWLVASSAALSAQPSSTTAIEGGLLAHWTFDEPDGVAGGDVPRVRGVHGGALELAGRHAMRVQLPLAAEELRRITFSAWTRPTDLTGYREIFRQECPRRLLFSYQLGGTILSLGLDVGGYVECDARINPAEVLDGGWHHAAATFDGKLMRVYLDGEEVARLERPGVISVQPEVPGFIASSSGRGEHFQGGLDDLRIYAEALSPQEIAAVYRSGVESLARLNEELQRQLDEFYVDAGTFAATLARSREHLAERKIEPSPEFGGVLSARLKTRFPEDYRDFVELAGASPMEYLRSEGDELHVETARRLVELLLEYRPLTDEQKKKETPEEARRRQEAEATAAELERLEAAGEASRFSPRWIELLLDAVRRIDFRPVVSEAVAPYVTPETPATRDLAPAEAQAALERDWLHQADGDASPERIREEIAWGRQLADRIRSASGERCDLSTALAELVRLEREAASLSKADAALYFRVRKIKRAIMLANPVVDFDKVLFVDMPYPQGKEWRHETRHRLGYMAVPGGRLLVLEGLAPGGRLRQLMPGAPLHGSFWRPDLSWDAQRVLVSFKPHNEKSFHLYEINVDGTGLRQLTDGPYDDLDPIYLPGGEHIIFSTTRGHTYVRCMPPTNAYVLARCDADGRNVYLISRNNEPDYLPSVMHDGRVIYTRWEYTDKPLWRAQGLWTVNPDGTQVSTFWGNQSVWPDLVKDARSIPGSRRVMFTGSAHHDWFAGSVGILDPDRGFNFPDGLTKVTAELPWPESGNGPVDPVESPRYHSSGQYEAYYSSYPLGEQDFLVSASRQGKFVLYLMDVDGNRELIYEGVHNVLHALPLRPRPQPPVIADRVQWPGRRERLRPKPGVIYSSNVYQGAPDELQGKARFLRVLNIEHKTYTYWHKRPYISTGPVVSMVQSEGVKRVLGTVPIEADGSVAFYAPAGLPLHFQLLDGDHRALQTMRSFTGVMPGERRGCLGCHELHSTTPQPEAASIALARGPQKITPPPWGPDTVSYARYVQPVLDRYCGECHQGEGDARDEPDLTRRPGFLDFDEPYVTLIGRPTWGKPYELPEPPPPGFGVAGMLMVEAYGKTDPAAYRTPPPMTALSYTSRLVELASSGEHYDVRVDPLSLQRLIAWVDAMCPYLGDVEVREIADPEFQGVDWLAIRPRIHSAPTIIRPGPVDLDTPTP